MENRRLFSCWTFCGYLVHFSFPFWTMYMCRTFLKVTVPAKRSLVPMNNLLQKRAPLCISFLSLFISHSFGWLPKESTTSSFHLCFFFSKWRALFSSLVFFRTPLRYQPRWTVEGGRGSTNFFHQPEPGGVMFSSCLFSWKASCCHCTPSSSFYVSIGRVQNRWNHLKWFCHSARSTRAQLLLLWVFAFWEMLVGWAKRLAPKRKVQAAWKKKEKRRTSLFFFLVFTLLRCFGSTNAEAFGPLDLAHWSCLACAQDEYRSKCMPTSRDEWKRKISEEKKLTQIR